MAAILKLKMVATSFHVIITMLVFNYCTSFVYKMSFWDRELLEIGELCQMWGFYNGGHFEIQNGRHAGDEKM